MRFGIKSLVLVIFLFVSVWVLGRVVLPLCLPFLLGACLALGAEPLVSFLCGPVRLPRAAGAGIGVAGTFALAASLVLSLAALLLQQLRALAGILPDLERAAATGFSLLEQALLRLGELAPAGIRPLVLQQIRDLFSDGTALLGRGASWILGLAGGVITHIPDGALSLFTAILSGFMISAKLPRLRLWFRKAGSRESMKPVLAAARRLKSTLGRWLVAQCKLSAITWLILTGGFILLAIPFAPLWALGAALLDALPVLGTGTVLLPWSLICLLEGSRARAAGLLSIYITVALTRTALEPRLVGRQLGLDSLVTLAALYAGYRLWGFGGMILAPMLAAAARQLLSGTREAPFFPDP